MTEEAKDLKGPEISRKLFGGVLTYDGAGYYPGLELLNMVYGVKDEILPGKEKKEIKVSLSSHDFARRLVWDNNFDVHPMREQVFVDEGEAEEALKHLLECLQLKIPGSTLTPKWTRAHFFPYTKSLIHWDARSRDSRTPNKINIERQYLRGGGALAFKVLRLDPNQARLNNIREGFAALYGKEVTALDRLTSVLSEHGFKVKHEDTSVDRIEFKSVSENDELEETYRDGVSRILGHTDLPSVSRIRTLMNWTGFWLILVEMDRAAKSLERPSPYILCDCCDGNHPQLRRGAQRCLKQILGLIENAVKQYVDSQSKQVKKADQLKIRGFFWATASTVKLLNAWKGRKHFTLGLDILETLVLAGCEKGGEIPFDRFLSEWLYEKCRIVIGRSAAEKSNLLTSLDSFIFEDNENELSNQMSAAGLLTQYSDATMMVSAGGLK